VKDTAAAFACLLDAVSKCGDIENNVVLLEFLGKADKCMFGVRRDVLEGEQTKMTTC